MLKDSREWSLKPGAYVIFETKSGLVVSTRSRVLAAEDVALVGSWTTCEKENTEHRSTNSLANVDDGNMVGGSLVHLILGMLKSPNKNKGK